MDQSCELPCRSKYKYKVTILNSVKHNKKAVSRFLHHFSDRFTSMIHVRMTLLEELGDDLSDSIRFDVGYYENRTARNLLVTSEDLKLMYEGFKTKEEIHLWCNASDESTAHEKGKKRKRECHDEELDDIFQELKKKHKEKYSVPQLKLWARMLLCSTHESYEEPPPVPMFSEPQAKRPKETLADSISQGLTAFSKAIQSPPPLQPVSTSTNKSACGISPGTNIELRMKNLEQLRCAHKLYEDNAITAIDFAELKKNILESIRKLEC